MFVTLLHYPFPFIKITSTHFDEDKDQLFPPVSAREFGVSVKFPTRCSWTQIIYLIFFTLLPDSGKKDFPLNSLQVIFEVELHYPANGCICGLMNHTVTYEVICFL